MKVSIKKVFGKKYLQKKKITLFSKDLIDFTY